MEATKFFSDHLIDQTVVGLCRFPAHTTNKTDRFHVDSSSTVYFACHISQIASMSSNASSLNSVSTERRISVSLTSIFCKPATSATRSKNTSSSVLHLNTGRNILIWVNTWAHLNCLH